MTTIADIDFTSARYGPHPTITDDQASALASANEILVTLPEDWVSQIPVIVPEDLPQEIIVVAPADLPSEIIITLPDGGLPGSIPIHIPQDVLDIINRVGAPPEAPEAPPEAPEAPPEAPEAPPEAPEGNDSPIDYAHIAQVFETLGVSEDKIQAFLDNPDLYRTDLPPRAGKPAIAFPEQVATDIGQTKTDIGRVASASEAQRDYWAATADLKLADIKTNTSDTKTNTDSLSDMKGVLEEIKANTAKQARIYDVDIDQDVTVERISLADVPEDELQTFAEIVSGRVFESLNENTENARALSGTDGG